MNGYTAANNMPWKLLKNPRRIGTPYHIQFIPTNRCNGNCPWCSCKGVDRTLELETQEAIDIINYFAELGAKAITITGGGEPLLHKGFERIFEAVNRQGIKSGLVSNSILLSQGKYAGILNDNLTWCRLSVTDTESGKYDVDKLVKAVNYLPDVAVGISFTVTENVNMDTVKHICIMAEAMENITHIRFTQDIFKASDEANITAMKRVENTVKHMTDKAIIQFRNDPTVGAKKCHISKLKPIINCDGFVYPCCGVQYATDETHTMPEAMRMCYWNDFDLTPIFNGGICKVCYYNDYNRCIDNIKAPIEHEDFI